MSEREVAELLKGEQEDGLQATSLCVEGRGKEMQDAKLPDI